MKHKILCVFLCLAMLLSLGTVTVLADDGALTPGTDVMLASKGSITVDGQFQPSMGACTEMLTPDKVIGDKMYAGASWDEDGLIYMMVVSVSNPISEIKMDIGGKSATFTETAAGGITGAKSAFGKNGETYFAEISVPMWELSFVKESDTSVYTLLKLAVTGSSANGTFDGKLFVTANETFRNSSVLGQSSNDGTIQTVWGTVKSTNGVYSLSNSSNIYNKIQSMRADMETVTSLNIKVTELKELDDLTAVVEETGGLTGNPPRIRLRINRGMNNDSSTATNPKFSLVLSVYNVKDTGLVLVRYNSYNANEKGIALGKNVGDEFALSVKWGMDYSAQIYVDGISVGAFPAYSGTQTPWQGKTWNGESWGIYIEASNGNDAEATTVCTYNSLSLSKYTALNADDFLTLAKTRQLIRFYGTQEQTDALATEKTYNVRLVATVDTLSYAEVGFELVLSYTDGEGAVKKTDVQDIRLTKVYSSLLAENEPLVAPNGTWFAAAAVTNVPADVGNMTFTVKPYVVESEGSARVYGVEQTVVYSGETGMPVAAAD